MIFFHTHLASITKLTLLCLSLLLVPIKSYAMDVSFTWTANLEPITGYKLYYKKGVDSAPPYQGTGFPEGNAPILLGNVTTYTVTGLSPNETYHFVLTAYNEVEESVYSTLVTVSTVPTPIINNISIK